MRIKFDKTKTHGIEISEKRIKKFKPISYTFRINLRGRTGVRETGRKGVGERRGRLGERRKSWRKEKK